ncbi:hypothetical protein [Aquabacterium humicola]|uniref:hypothetical protein n=1 Tax=Aquabacterium humicola TaxID=3237377 RepID=UPI002542F6C0|nr:hypothetical protein [Rubrivivax pictus]
MDESLRSSTPTPAPDPAPDPVPGRAPDRPRGLRAWIGQGLLYGAFAAAVGVFSHWPVYHPLPPDTALVKLSFVHAGQPAGACRRLSAEELARRPPNMRAPVECPRGRAPVVVELDIDGRNQVSAEVPASGLAHDGASALYRRLVVPAGERLLAVRLRDDGRAEGFGHVLERRVTLAPSQVLVIDFDAERGGLIVQ